VSDPLIIRKDFLPGGDKSTIDFEIVGSIKLLYTTVTEKMYKVKSKTYIKIKDACLPNEVIQVGNLGLRYKIIGFAKITDNGYIQRIKRIDGASTTLTDINATFVGGKVKIKSRRTANSLLGF
jgi:hypothetical protein